MASQSATGLKYYTFDPLEDEEKTRILKIHAGPRSIDLIICELKHSKNPKDDDHGFPKDKPDFFGYEALSWCWGRGLPDRDIQILKGNDVFVFKVHENLYQALLSLRHELNHRYLWVDAICINQSNPEERSQQVARMNEVYGDAKRVCIWLGTSTETSKKAMDFIPKILEVFQFDELCTNKQHVDEWIALLDLLKRPWFSRRWVVQEVLLAQDAIVHCGSGSVSWKQLAATISLLNNADTAMKNLSELMKSEAKGKYRNANDFSEEVAALGASKLVDTSSRLFKKSIGEQSQRISSLEEIVARLAMFRASDPRDIIYALLALAKDSQPSIEGIPDHLGARKLNPSERKALQTVARLLPKPYRESYVVDYKQRIVDVYQQFIAFAIARSDPVRALDVICRPFARSYPYGEDLKFKQELLDEIPLDKHGNTVPLPSWIPNASEMEFAEQTEAGESGTWFMTRNRGDLFVSPPDAPSYYSAAGTRKHKIRFHKYKDLEHYSMFVTGFILDEIKDADPASQLGNLPATWMKRGNRHAKKDEAVFWKTLVADRGPKGNNAPPLFYENTIEAAFKHAREDGGFNTPSHIQSRSTGIVADALRQIQATVYARCLFETSRGHLGLAPGKTVDMMRGSSRLVVCILYGCSVPVVLREVRKADVELEAERESLRKDGEERFERIKEKLEKRIRPVQLRFKKRPSTNEGRHERPSTPNGAPIHSNANDQDPNAGASVTVAAVVPRSDSNEVGHVANAKRNDTAQAHGDKSSTSDTGGIRIARHSMSSVTVIRVLVLHASVAFVAFVVGERMAAALLVGFTMPHVAMELLAERDRQKDGKLEVHVIDIVVGFCCLCLLLIGSYSTFGIFVAAPFLILFPDMLPLPLAEPFKRSLDSLTRLSLADIPGLVMSHMPHRLIIRSTEPLTAQSVAPDPQAVATGEGLPATPTESTPSSVQEAQERARVAVPAQATEATDSPAKSDQIATAPEPEALPSEEPLRCWYELVGECYVHNMMNGEAIEAQNKSILDKDIKDGRIFSQEFELR